MGVFDGVASAVAEVQATAASKATIRNGVAVSDSAGGHVQVQIGAQVWEVTDPTGRVVDGDQVTIIEQGNTARVTSILREQAGGWLAMAPPTITLPWWTATAPDGWWLMQGQAIDPALYPACAAVFGATLPDMRDRMGVGASATKPVKSTGGSPNITTAQLPAHTHPPAHSTFVENYVVKTAATGTGTAVGDAGATSTETGSTGGGEEYWPRYAAHHWIVRMG